MNHFFFSFLKEHFDNFTLRPPLFYLWRYGLRFEISMPWVEHQKRENLQQIKERSLGIFNHMFHDSDEMFLITDIQCERTDPFLQKRPLKLYLNYVKDNEVIRKLQHRLLPSVFIEDEADEECGEMVTHRFILPCKKKDFRYQALLEAISYEDFPQPSQIAKGLSGNAKDVYFVNETKKMIYHLYDDRGCDVIAANKADLQPLYDEFNDWILDYDREKIDRLFNPKV
ncbi:DUF3885 domain-containing protein [Aureibacillus halotolerans]|uniref:Uncharacterized protein DUF3885 n=1 Tax=Aureibacillus halotolerans TaxID=1508390 RepID=A0A4R6TTE6_9BACI|nr:DUF3885 domain-containing protein [Aureibacillus halotolerans]TDQ36376.1 uncharacterized protein DUF3885 [Aureibacillus halotolerans]